MNGMAEDQMKYLRLLSETYPTRQAVSREIINLMAILRNRTLYE